VKVFEMASKGRQRVCAASKNVRKSVPSTGRMTGMSESKFVSSVS